MNPVSLAETVGAFEHAPRRAPAGEPPPFPLAQLPTHELCRLWTASSTSTSDSVLMQLRGQLLDELELRDPIGFQWWLLADATTGGDPWPHFDAPSDPVQGLRSNA